MIDISSVVVIVSVSNIDGNACLFDEVSYVIIVLCKFIFGQSKIKLN